MRCVHTRDLPGGQLEAVADVLAPVTGQACGHDGEMPAGQKSGCRGRRRIFGRNGGLKTGLENAAFGMLRALSYGLGALSGHNSGGYNEIQ